MKVRIDPAKLTESRENLGLSMDKLAAMTWLTRESIGRLENSSGILEVGGATARVLTIVLGTFRFIDGIDFGG